ncbi:MAG: hypothetical protein BM564_06300 [Bacteroidetes bacterium MedPE-SWsnd-G2]|nr:MAG: hypothetical protein BM564_06300 [Bacteroidetes bacterium MedPE-SWsnd-G2]
MTSDAKTPQEYIDNLPEDRVEPIQKLRQTVLDNMSKDIEECMNYGMLGYVIPHSIYPDGYHCNPKLPLPLMNIASQKNFVAFYHMGIYADKELYDWFVTEYPNHCKYKLDMGKSCIRFKKMNDIPYQLIGELVKKMNGKQWIDLYETNIKKSK